MLRTFKNIKQLQRTCQQIQKIQPFQNTLQYKPQYYLLQNTKRTRIASKKLEFDIPHIEKELFQEEANYFLYRLQQAFEKMKSDEDKIKDIEFKDLEDKLNIELKVDTANGTYTWHTDTKERVLFFFSPYTGVFKYYFDENTQHWISNKDKHLHIEHLVREITWNFRGLLEI